MRPVSFARAGARSALILAAGVASLVACSNAPSKEELEAAKNTFTCQLTGERLVVRFDSGEARLLMPGGERVVLYQIAAHRCALFNGTLELRGKAPTCSSSATAAPATGWLRALHAAEVTPAMPARRAASA
jgi:hypothetical protein